MNLDKRAKEGEKGVGVCAGGGLWSAFAGGNVDGI